MTTPLGCAMVMADTAVRCDVWARGSSVFVTKEACAHDARRQSRRDRIV